MRAMSPRTIPVTAITLLVLAAPSLSQLDMRLGSCGEIDEILVGGRPYFRDFGVTIIRPGWEGNYGDQRDADPSTARATGADDRLTFEVTLGEAGASWSLRQEVRREPGAVTIEWEITPLTDILAETILVGGLMPTDEHAGRTRYVAASADALIEGLCPADLDAEAYAFLRTGAMDWVALVGPDGEALRLLPRNLGLGLQDNRTWDIPGFQLMGSGGGGLLPAGQPIRFGLRFEASTATDVATAAETARRETLVGMDLTDDRPLEILSVTLGSPGHGAATPGRERTGTYQAVELVAEVAAHYDNPFDPEQILVDGIITRPDGDEVRAPGFFYVPLALSEAGGREQLRRTGPADFRVRYTPTVEGEHRIALLVRDRTGERRSEELLLTVELSPEPGFVRVPHGSRYFIYDDGRPFFAVGENLCWANGPTPVATYREWLRSLGAAGGNWARLWLSFNEKGQEWMPHPTPKRGGGAYLGLGRYALDCAWRLDDVFREAAAAGVSLMPALGTYGEFTEGGYFDEGSWVSNPYSAANGGPCASPADFWTHPEARRLYKQRLRYLVARWGYATNLFAWEFWNEVPPTPEQVAWVAEMAAYLKEIDPNRHMVSTTYGDASTWDCPDIDFTMTHFYGSAGNIEDFTPIVREEIARARVHPKPYLLAEFGIDWQTDDGRWDPTGAGLNMHNGAWAAALGGAAGTSMLWYWDGYVHPHDLYHLLTPVRRFADTVDWPRAGLEPLAGVEVSQPEGHAESFTELSIPATVEWGKSDSSEYTPRHDGTVLGGPVARTIGSPNRHDPAELFQKLTWRLDMPSPGEVCLRLGFVSGSARLQVRLDGELIVDRDLTTGPEGEGPWAEARWFEQWDVWQCRYDEDIPIAVPEGEHVLEISNADGDWLQIQEIRLPGYRSSRYPKVNVVASSGLDLVLLWLQNGESTWRTAYEGRQPTPLEGLGIVVPVPAAGRWRAEWWDTWTGEVMTEETVTARDGRVALQAPVLRTDVALRLERRP